MQQTNIWRYNDIIDCKISAKPTVRVRLGLSIFLCQSALFEALPVKSRERSMYIVDKILTYPEDSACS